MSWLDIAWLMLAGTCAAFALLALRIAGGGRDWQPYLFLGLASLSVACVCVLELAIMRADNLDHCRSILRWASVPIAAMITSVTGFVWTYFRTGRRWLALAAVGLIVTSELANLVSAVPAVRHAVALRQSETLGGARFTQPVVESGPWAWVEVASVLFLTAYLVDASMALWRKGLRRRAVVVGGGVVFFLVISRGHAWLVENGIIQSPYFVSFSFTGVLLAMGIELADDVVRAARLAKSELELQHARTQLAHVGRVSMLGQLASALAHELNQPLGAILRNAEAAELYLQSERPDLDELRAIVADIRQDDRRAGEVIDRLRSMLKRGEMQSQEIDVASLLADAATLARADAAHRRVAIALDAPGELPRVRGDRIHLQQVLLNLLINAMDAVAEQADGSRHITLSARACGSNQVSIAVSDSGRGIPPDLLAQVFEPFFTTKAHGMGMGLAISQTIISAHRGELVAENHSSSRGATFRFTLPATQTRSVQ